MDNNDNTVQCVYSGGVLSQVVDAAGRVLVLDYSGGLLSSVTDNEGRVWSLAYSGGKLAQVADLPLSGQNYHTDFGYNGDDVASVTNRLNQTWQFGYGAAGVLAQMTDADDHLWWYSIAANNNAPSGENIQWPADVVGIGSVTDPTNAQVLYGFDNQGRIVAVRGATDNRAVFTYDAQNNRLTQETDSGATQQWTYDSLGNATSSTDPLGNITQMGYDGNGRLVSLLDPLGNETIHEYDSRGNRIRTTDPLGHATETDYDAAGQVTEARDPRGFSTIYQHDGYGNLTLVRDPLGNGTEYQYPGDGQMDRLIARADALGRATEYTYDAWGRRIGTSYPTTGNPGVSLVYDAEGRITQSTDGTGTRTYQYDAWGRKTSMTDPMGNTQATYDAAGRMLTQTDVSGRTHSYGHDALKRLSQVSAGSETVQYTYTPDSQVEFALYPNNTRAEYGYDVAGRTTSIVHRRLSDSSVLVSYEALYDEKGRITEVTEQSSGALTTYQYDDAGRLLHEERVGDRPYSGAYQYDAAGNRLSAHRAEDGVTSHEGIYSYDDASRLQQVVDQATSTTDEYAWNADGTLASYPGPGYARLLTHDEEGHLTAIHRDFGNGNVQLAYEYSYGADGGRRWRKDYTGTGVWTWFPCGVACCAGELVEKQSNLLGTLWQTSALTLRGENLISRNGEFHHADLLGSMAIITNSNGAILSNGLYDNFGVERSEQGEAQTKSRWNTSQTTDETILFQSGGVYLPQCGIKFSQQRKQIAPTHPQGPVQGGFFGFPSFGTQGKVCCTGSFPYPGAPSHCPEKTEGIACHKDRKTACNNSIKEAKSNALAECRKYAKHCDCKCDD